MKAVQLYLLLINVAFGQQISAREGIEWGGASNIVIGLIIVILIVLIVLIIVAVSIQEKNKKEKLEIHSEQQFLRQCERFALTKNEEFALRQFLKQINIVSYPAVFNSVSIFEEAIEKECQILRRRWGISSKTENATLIIRTIRRKLGYDRLLSETPLQSTRNIEVGQLVELSLTRSGSEKIEKIVVMESTELELTLHYDIKKRIINFEEHQKIIMTYTRQGDAIYTVPVEVYSDNASTGMLRVMQTVEMERKQFRNDVRLSVDLPLQCRLLHRIKANKNAPLGKLIQNSYILDISGGGIAFIADTELKKGDRLSLSFALNREKVVLKGEVVGIMKKERRGETRYKHRVIFKDPKRKDTDLIVKFIFEKQREQMHMNFNGIKN